MNEPARKESYSKTVHTGKADRPDTGSDNYPNQVDSTDLPEDQSIHKDAAFLATSSIWGKFR